MIGHLRVHGADDGDVVGMRGGAREDLADLESALTVARKLEGRGQGCAGLALGAEVLARQGLAGVFREGRLGVEGVHLRRPAIEKEMHDAAGPRCEVG